MNAQLRPAEVRRLQVSRLRRGSSGWAFVAAGVILWDILAADDEQLTHAFRRGWESKKGRVLVIAAWGILTGHLFALLPEQADPIHQVNVLRLTVQRRRRHDI